MIVYRKGDVTEPKEKLIAHGCNAKGKMNSGVAKALRAKWPEIFPPYQREYELHGLALGQMILVDVGEHQVANLITQDQYGYDGEKYVDYDGMRLAFQILSKYMRENGIEEVAIPRIGAGLGGGDWLVIERMIEEEFAGLLVAVYDKDESNE